MVLKFGQTKTEDAATLIARKQYARAIEVIREQLASGKSDPRLRLQLADALVLAKKEREAVMILVPLADEFAREGFAAKAISVLKKIQKIDPGRKDIDSRLASLIEEKQRQATVTLPPPSSSLPEIGIEEIGFELSLGGGPVAVPARDEVGEAPAEIGFEPGPAPTIAVEPPPPAAESVLPAPVVDRDLIAEEAGLEELPLEAQPTGEALPLEVEADLESLPMEAEPEILLEPEPDANPMTDSAFADELMAVIESAFPGGFDMAPEPAPALGNSSGAQIVVSPLFKDFSVDEMVAVIHGLNLLSFGSGDVIITEGEPGDSLYMLTTGTVKAYKKNAAGKQVLVGELSEGAFFGEISMLTRKPRNATIAAATRCELLELDRPTLESITQTHPHVLDVLREFARERLKKKA